MKYRKLRIAWSVTWGVVAVLLVVLWVRSVQWEDTIYLPAPLTRYSIVLKSELGVAGIGLGAGRPWIEPWTMRTEDANPLWELNQKLPPDKRPFQSRFWGTLSKEGYTVYVPYWFIIPVGTLLSAASWLPLKRFSLRTLLIATTLVAVLLGLIVWLSRR